MKRLFCVVITISILISLSVPVHADTTRFRDVKTSDWFYEYVEKLTAIGIIDGFADNTFRPHDNVAVDQFIKMTVIATGNKIDQGKDYWAKPYIDFAIGSGLVVQGEFGDYCRPITRGEMARILVRALKDVAFLKDLSKYESMIKDYNSISEEFREYILKACISGLMTGYPDGNFKYNSLATRAEAVTMIQRLIDPTIRAAAKDPENPGGYINYIAPEDLIRKVIELETSGNFLEAYKYLDEDFVKSRNYTVKKYRNDSRYHVSYMVKAFMQRYPDEEVFIRCKIINQIDDNTIEVAYGYYDKELANTNNGPYSAQAKKLIKRNGYWYIDLSNIKISDGSYIFRFDEGK